MGVRQINDKILEVCITDMMMLDDVFYAQISTENESFMEIFKFLNDDARLHLPRYHILEINNPAILDIDESMDTSEVNQMVCDEIKRNPWYYIREVAKIDLRLCLMDMEGPLIAIQNPMEYLLKRACGMAFQSDTLNYGLVDKHCYELRARNKEVL